MVNKIKQQSIGGGVKVGKPLLISPKWARDQIPIMALGMEIGTWDGRTNPNRCAGDGVPNP